MNHADDKEKKQKKEFDFWFINIKMDLDLVLFLAETYITQVKLPSRTDIMVSLSIKNSLFLKDLNLLVAL